MRTSLRRSRMVNHFRMGSLDAMEISAYFSSLCISLKMSSGLRFLGVVSRLRFRETFVQALYYGALFLNHLLQWFRDKMDTTCSF